jgi:hypothetical protein
MADTDENTTPQSEVETIRLSRTTQPVEHQPHPQIPLGVKSISRYLETVGDAFLAFAKELQQEAAHDQEVRHSQPHLSNLLSELGKLAKIVSSIHQGATEDSDFCLSCICEFLKRTTNRNAVELQKFIIEKECNFHFEQTAAKLSSVPLAEHMKQLGSGDRYDVISDIVSWRGRQLKEFEDEHEKAVSKGVLIRRVFNLMLQHPLNRVKYDDIKMVLTRHLKNAEKWNKDNPGRYDVAVIGAPNIIDLENADSSVTDDEFATEVHFGIFSRTGKGQTLVEYRVASAHVSKMTLINNKAAIHDNLQTFEIVWGVAPKLSQTLIDTILKDYKKWTTPP